MANSQVYHQDCMIGMKEYPDAYFDLAIVDPPYGIDIMRKAHAFGNTQFDIKDWDNERPSKAYFEELFRVSKNQIIWGANYFLDYLPPTKCMVFWDKCNTHKDKNSGRFADGEIAWTSYNLPTCLVSLAWLRGQQPDRNMRQERIHPTQKPIELYLAVLQKFAKKGEKILDTHMGSQSSRIAAHKLGFDYWGFEIDETYFMDGNQRFFRHF